MTVTWLHARTRGSPLAWIVHPFVPVVGVALLAISLLVGLAGFAALETTRTFEKSAQQGVHSNGRAAVRALELQGQAFTRAVTATALHGSVIDSLRAPAPASLAAVNDQLAGLTRTTGGYSAFVTDNDGLIVAFYPLQPAIIGQDFSFRDWFQGLSRSDRPYISSAYRTAATGRPLVAAVSAPVIDGSRIVGSVTTLWSLDTVRALVKGARVDDGVTLVVTDQHGVPLASDLASDERGQPLPVKISAATTRALHGLTTGAIVDEKFAETLPVPELGWTITATLPVSVGLAPTVAFKRNLVLALGGAVLFVVMVTALTGRLARARAAEKGNLLHARGALRDTENRFQRMFDEALTGQLLVDRHGDITRVNTALERLIDRASDQLVGAPFVSMFEAELDQLAISRVIESGQGELRGTMALHAGDDGDAWGLVALSWLDEPNGERALFAQVVDATATVAASLEREHELRSKDQFLAHISHELRSPLAVVHQFSSLLIDRVGGPLTSDQEEFLDIVARNVRQLKVMIDDLLEVSRAGAGGLTFECEPLALGVVLRQIIAGYARTADDRQITLQLECGDLPLVVANAERVHEVLTNLVDNALKFTPAGGLIAVKAVPKDGSVQVSVRDTGRGIKIDDVDRIFEKSFQVDHNSVESRKGLGLGLYICRALIETQGGRIWAASPPAGGTTVTFTLPCPVRRRADRVAVR